MPKLSQIRKNSEHRIEQSNFFWESSSKRIRDTIFSGLIFRPHRERQLSVRYPYRTGLFVSDRESGEATPIFGRGWHIDFRYAVEIGLSREPILENFTSRLTAFRAGTDSFSTHIKLYCPEVIIFARNIVQAQSIKRDLVALTELTRGESIFDFGETEVFYDEIWKKTYPDKPYFPHSIQRLTTDGIGTAAKAIIQLRKNREYRLALWRLFYSGRQAFHHPLDFSPSMPKYWPSFSKDTETDLFIAYALAITSAYSALEELRLDFKPPRGQQLINGTHLNTNVRQQICTRLAALGIDISDEIIWLRRGSRSRIDSLLPTLGRVASWQRGNVVRDRMIKLPDAIILAKAIRNKAGAHQTSLRTEVLRAHDLENVRSLPRIILHDLLNMHSSNSPEHIFDFVNEVS